MLIYSFPHNRHYHFLIIIVINYRITFADVHTLQIMINSICQNKICQFILNQNCFFFPNLENNKLFFYLLCYRYSGKYIAEPAFLPIYFSTTHSFDHLKMVDLIISFMGTQLKKKKIFFFFFFRSSADYHHYYKLKYGVIALLC